MDDPFAEPSDRAVEVPETFTCVECGGTCHRLSYPRHREDEPSGFVSGDVVAYRCADCNDRFDVEVP